MTVMALGLSGAASADVMMKLPAGSEDGKFVVYKSNISDSMKPRSERPQPVVDSLKTVNGASKFDLNITEPAQVIITAEDGNGRDNIQIFALPGDNLVVEVTSISPLEYNVSGTQLMEDISMLNQKAKEIVNRYRAASASEDEIGMATAQKDYENLYKDFISSNPSSPATVYAVLNLDGEDFLTAFANLPASLKTSALYPIAEKQKTIVESSMEAEKKMEAMQSGHVDAPDFTLKNLEGKDVKLSDFRGKWVIIDFWGSWCGWCIKGFPKLKDAYEQYQPELEIIGVDCNESEANWRKGVEKYQLPWVNVYNPESSSVLRDYGVQGFPTKVIVNPEGKIADITVGENPAFFDTLAKLINER